MERTAPVYILQSSFWKEHEQPYNGNGSDQNFLTYRDGSTSTDQP